MAKGQEGEMVIAVLPFCRCLVYTRNLFSKEKMTTAAIAVEHRTTKGFWDDFYRLPSSAQKQAKKQFKLLKHNPSHPSLQFEKLSGFENKYSARINRQYRAIAEKTDKGF